jgi:predicted nucleic acid-binding protein
MFLIDTDILIEFYKNNPHIFEELRYIQPHNITISVVTQAELYFGALNKVELNKIKRHLSSISCIPVDRATSQQWLFN